MRAWEVPACVHAGTSFLLVRALSREREDSSSEKEVVELVDSNEDQPGQEKENPGTSGKSKIKLATEVVILLTAAVELARSLLSCCGS